MINKPIAKKQVDVKYVDIRMYHIIFAAIPDIYQSILDAQVGEVSEWVNGLSLLVVGPLFDTREVADWILSLGE